MELYEIVNRYHIGTNYSCAESILLGCEEYYHLHLPEQARKLDAAGQNRALPLFGLPVLVKDNIDVKGLHTTAGSLSLADNVAAEDAPVIANLRRNGAVILGKTNMTEFANYTSPDMPNGYSSRAGR